MVKKKDWLVKILEQAIDKNVEVTAKAIHLEIEKRFPKEIAIDESLNWSVPYRCAKSYNRAIRESKKKLL